MASLFEEAVAASRLNPVVAPFTLTRLLLRAKVFKTDTFSPEELLRALPYIDEELRTLLSKEDHRAAMNALRKLAHRRLAS